MSANTLSLTNLDPQTIFISTPDKIHKLITLLDKAEDLDEYVSIVEHLLKNAEERISS